MQAGSPAEMCREQCVHSRDKGLVFSQTLPELGPETGCRLLLSLGLSAWGTHSFQSHFDQKLCSMTDTLDKGPRTMVPLTEGSRMSKMDIGERNGNLATRDTRVTPGGGEGRGCPGQDSSEAPEGLCISWFVNFFLNNNNKDNQQTTLSSEPEFLGLDGQLLRSATCFESYRRLE